jgi:hypothetical protein
LERLRKNYAKPDKKVSVPMNLFWNATLMKSARYSSGLSAKCLIA